MVKEEVDGEKNKKKSNYMYVPREEPMIVTTISERKMARKATKQSPKKGSSSHRKRNGSVIREQQPETSTPKSNISKLSDLEQAYMDILEEASTTAKEAGLITPPKES